MSVKYVGIGFTAHQTSKAFIKRYKSEEDLRDVFELQKLSKASTKRLYIFEVCSSSNSSCLWLLSFDVKEVRVRDPKRCEKLFRKPSHEYSEIKEMLFSYLCGSVDASTYICLEDYSGPVESYLLQVADRDKFRVEKYYVKPYSGKEKVFVREAIMRSIMLLEAKALAIASRVEKVDSRALWRVEKIAREFLESLTLLENKDSLYREKLSSLGIDIDINTLAKSTRERVEKALELRFKSVREAHSFSTGRKAKS